MAAVSMQHGWRARLELAFEPRTLPTGARTVLAHRRHCGPLLVQRPFYPEGPVCHVVLVHPPGGMVGGDALELEVDCAPRADVLMTTPGATKCYRSNGPGVVVTQHLQVRRDAALEWLPQELIVFEGGALDTVTRVDLEPGARFLGWEILCLGRPAADERFAAGSIAQRFQVHRGERPLLMERLQATGGGGVLHGPWGLHGHAVSGTLVALPADASLRDQVRRCAVDEPGFTASLLDEVLVCRYLGESTARARRCLERAWAIIRPAVLGRAARQPRIWRT